MPTNYLRDDETLRIPSPALRRLSPNRKLRFGPWFTPALVVLRAGRRLRGTPLDPFARLSTRREEQALIAWYEGLLDSIVARLRPLTADVALEVADLPELIRGYEQVKSASAERAQARAAELLARLDRPPLPMAGALAHPAGSG